MNTSDNSIDRFLADVSEEAAKADAELLEGFARTEIPKDVRHRTLTAVKNGKRTSPSERLYKKAARIAAAFVAVICIAYAANIYATYERKEIWGIDIVDEGDYFTVSIISTQRSKNIIEKKRAPSIEPKNANKKTEQDRITSYITVYHQNDSTIMVYSQYCSTDSSKKYDDDCVFTEIWVKNNKALYIFFEQSGRSEIWWFDGEYFYSVMSYEGLSVEELTKIANSVE